VKINITTLYFTLSAATLEGLPARVHEKIREFGGDPEVFQVSVTATKMGVSDTWKVDIRAQSTQPGLWPPQDAPAP
jgi:hypothetical protein